jgi:hypothetical protein
VYPRRGLRRVPAGDAGGYFLVRAGEDWARQAVRAWSRMGAQRERVAAGSGARIIGEEEAAAGRRTDGPPGKRMSAPIQDHAAGRAETPNSARATSRGLVNSL